MKKKILFVTKSEMLGGLEKVLIDIVDFLDNSIFDITVMTGTKNEDIAKGLPRNVKYEYLFKKKFRGLDRILVHLPSVILHKLFIRKKYDIEISFQEGYPTKIVAGSSRNTKKICWFHNDPYYYDFNLPYYNNKANLKKELNKYDKKVAVSEFIVEQYDKYLGIGNGINVIYNPIDYSRVKRDANEIVEDIQKIPDLFRLCYIGRLSEEKQVDMLIDSVQMLYEKYNSTNNLELIIIGDGHLYSQIAKKIEDLDAKEYIKLLGFKKNPYPYIKESTLLVCSSLTESFCLSVAEALILGTPVISTRCGGPEELLNKGEYGIVTENNSQSLFEGIEQIMTNKNLLTYYKNKIDNYPKKFEKEIIQYKVIDLLKEVLHEEDCII
ncbi:glycosyltransferase [Robertmurraya sp.]|uniref:glycosyltransferase n=1 Tax=Robertmurraya sp. TaxID=2837525 RepID=UPI003704A322